MSIVNLREKLRVVYTPPTNPGYTITYGITGCEKHLRFQEPVTGRWKQFTPEQLAAFCTIYDYQGYIFEIFPARCDWCRVPHARRKKKSYL